MHAWTVGEPDVMHTLLDAWTWTSSPIARTYFVMFSSPAAKWDGALKPGDTETVRACGSDHRDADSAAWSRWSSSQQAVAVQDGHQLARVAKPAQPQGALASVRRVVPNRQVSPARPAQARGEPRAPRCRRPPGQGTRWHHSSRSRNSGPAAWLSLANRVVRVGTSGVTSSVRHDRGSIEASSCSVRRCRRRRTAQGAPFARPQRRAPQAMALPVPE